MACSRYIALAFALCGCAQIAGLDDDAAPLGSGERQGSSTQGRCALLVPNVTDVDVGEVKLRGAVVGKASITLFNDGEGSIEVTPFVTGPATFSLVTPGPFRLGRKEQRVVTVSYAPQTLGRQDAVLDFSTTGSTCERPKSIAISGVGSDQSVLLSPPVVDFGDVACGTAPPAREVKITSELESAMQFDVSVKNPFFRLDPPSQLVAPSMSMPFRVSAGTASKDSLALVEDALTARAGSVSRIATVRMQPKGVILTFEPKTVDVDVSFSKTVTVRNVGNASGKIFIQAPSSKFGVDTGTPDKKISLDPGRSATFKVTYLDTKSSQQTANVTVEGATLCKSDTLVFNGKVVNDDGPGGPGGPGGWD